MNYTQRIEETRTRVVKGERLVKTQRERLVKLNKSDRDTWAAKRLLVAAVDTLQSNRDQLRDLLSR